MVAQIRSIKAVSLLKASALIKASALTKTSALTKAQAAASVKSNEKTIKVAKESTQKVANKQFESATKVNISDVAKKLSNSETPSKFDGNYKYDDSNDMKTVIDKKSETPSKSDEYYKYDDSNDKKTAIAKKSLKAAPDVMKKLSRFAARKAY